MNTKNSPSLKKVKKIGIIGAGISGLVTAKTLREYGFEIVVFEKESEIGGVWASSRRYPGLTTQNARDTYAFSDFPMPSHYPEWPEGFQVQEYLSRYAEHFGIASSIMFNSEVRHIQYDTIFGSWMLRVVRNRGKGSETLDIGVDYLVVCNGIFSEPFIPSFRGAEEFIAGGGRICHTTDFHSVAESANRNVVIIGFGKSSCDAASAAGANAQTTTLIAREILWKIPKRFFNVLNMKYILLTRLGEGLFPYINLRGADKFLHTIGKPIAKSLLNTVEWAVNRQFHLKQVGLHPGKPLNTIARSTVSLASEGFFHAVRTGKIRTIQSAIRRLGKGELELETGEILPADLIICGTGFKQVVPFFDEYVTKRITDDEGNFRLYRSILPASMPRLAFNGYCSSLFSQLNAEISALWIAEHLLGSIDVPPEAEMLREIDKRLRWMQERTEGKHAKGTNIIPFSMHHIDELLQDLNIKPNSMITLKEWLLPISPKNYKTIAEQLRRRRGTGKSVAEKTSQPMRTYKKSETAV